MNLIQLRTEVLAKGFDPIAYGGRINQYLNDAQSLIARRVDYYVEDAVFPIVTVAGTAGYSQPALLGRMRSVFDSDRNVAMQLVSLNDLDQAPGATGAPAYYAIFGKTLQFYPTPDGIYNLNLRYWRLPNPLVNDSDTPSMPADWHHILWVYATWMCYESEDDAQMGQYWQKRFQDELSEFTADQKFPDTDGPHQARGMWDNDSALGPTSGWTLYGA